MDEPKAKRLRAMLRELCAPDTPRERRDELTRLLTEALSRRPYEREPGED